MLPAVCTSCRHRRNAICTASTGLANIHFMQTCPINLPLLNEPTPAEPLTPVIAPLRNIPTHAKPWEGNKPWSRHKITTIIPVLEHTPLLDLVIESIRLQTVSSLIILVDTGSIETTSHLDSLRAFDLEVLSIRSQGWQHPSWPVAAAIDTAWSLVNTEYVFLTHNDCILKRQSALADLKTLCQTFKAVGHQISPRRYVGWEKELGHTFTMLHVPTCDDIGMSWNMRAYCRVTGRPLDPMVCGPNDPDTERFMNWHLQRANIVPHFTGTEQNHSRTNDDWIDHCRSLTSTTLYDSRKAAICREWEADAIEIAIRRHALWKK